MATEVGGNRTTVGDAGLLVPANDPQALASAILQAINSSDDTAARARSRIVGLFPKEKREKELARLIDKLVP